MAKTKKLKDLPLATSLTGAEIVGLDADGNDKRFPIANIVRSERGIAYPDTIPDGDRFVGETWKVDTGSYGETFAGFGNQEVPLKIGDQYVSNARFVYDAGSWEMQYELVDASSEVQTETIPPSKNIFNEQIPPENVGKVINVGLGSLTSNAAYSTSDYIDISSYPVGTVFWGQSRSGSANMVRSAFYNGSKTFISGTSPSAATNNRTKAASNYVYIRFSALNTALSTGFQLEANPDGPTPYVPFAPEKLVLVSVNGAVLPDPVFPEPEPIAADEVVVMSLNKFNPAAATDNRSLNGTTGQEDTTSGNSVSAKIPISANTDYAIWAYVAQTRGIAWYNANKEFISYSQFSTNRATFLSPVNAAYVQFDVKIGGVDFKRIVFTKGILATVWMSYNESKVLNNLAIGRTYGKSMALFGDSRTYTRTDMYEANWPNSVAKLGLAEIQNLASSGATYVERSGATNGLCRQVDQFVSEVHLPPDYAIFLGGINDTASTVGSLSTAISKATLIQSLDGLELLDKTEFHQAMLFCILKIKFLYPNCKVFVATPYKRAITSSRPIGYYDGILSAIKNIASFCSCPIIDQWGELNIVSAFEKDNAAGFKLRDGLHLTADSIQFPAKNIVSTVLRHEL